MAVFDTVANGVVIRRYDDDNRLYYEWDGDGNVIINGEPYTPEQNADADSRSSTYIMTYNEAALHDRARTALTQNSAWLNRSAAPTNAQTLAHIDRLTRQMNSLLRMEIRELLDIGDS